MTEFALSERLAQDTVSIGEFDLSSARLMNESRFPWAILVPRRPGVAELFELTRADRALLMEEIAAISEALQRLTGAGKINVAALGNQVRQLHVHVIGRHENDAAWPNPVWGVGAPRPYGPGEAEAFAAKLAKALQLGPGRNSL
ncbi:MAG: HIT domain-containing protein [Pseudomonadota bacterium]|nr:HIT domain-containing protein [Pseudomonadota bacterium]